MIAAGQTGDLTSAARGSIMNQRYSMRVIRIVMRFLVLILFFLLAGAAQAQLLISCVGSSDAADATADNNSHKIGLGDALGDTISVVFQSVDSVYFAFTTDRGQSWSYPAALCQGRYPAIDICHMGLRHLAWQVYDPSSENYEIYYDCLDDWHVPENVSQSPGQSTRPDLVVDSNGVVHIVWVEEQRGSQHIYYRTVWQYVMGDTVRLSDFGTSQATYGHPSISIFAPNSRVHAVWECYDPLCYSPYQIHLKYIENGIWSATSCIAHYWPLRHPSLDDSHGQDPLSFCYEDSSSGNLEATFCGGNGGGYATSGRSTYPVVSTVGNVWSYLFWQEDSAGLNTIYQHLYYGGLSPHWYAHGAINTGQETVRFPSVSGAYLVWTQGSEPPYTIFFADFGYPIGIEEASGRAAATLDATPNPFKTRTRFTIAPTGAASGVSIQIFDMSGRLVRELTTPASPYRPRWIEWSGDDLAGNELAAGVYLCWLKDGDRGVTSRIKVIKVK